MITVASGVHKSVSMMEYGASVPNRVRSIGNVASVAARLVATAVAKASTRKPMSRIGCGLIAGKSVARSGAAKNRSPSTAAKLSWNPASVAMDGLISIAITAATERIAPAFQSLRTNPPATPITAIVAARIALAVGARRKSAASMIKSTTRSCPRWDRITTRARNPATAPRTTRLNPLTARM